MAHRLNFVLFIFFKLKGQPCEHNSAFTKLTEVAPLVLQFNDCNKNREALELCSFLLYYIFGKFRKVETVDKYPQKENIKTNLFYSENLKDFQISETKQNPALLSQGRANFSGRSETSSLPPHQKWGVPQHLEFVSGDDGSSIKRLQTFSIVSIISPNLIHNSKKRDLKN